VPAGMSRKNRKGADTISEYGLDPGQAEIPEWFSKFFIFIGVF
jgi:hypothetical protein